MEEVGENDIYLAPTVRCMIYTASILRRPGW